MMEMIVVGVFTLVGFILGAMTALLGATYSKAGKDEQTRRDIS